MYFDLTEDEMEDVLFRLTARGAVDYLKNNGITFKKRIIPAEVGVYRRVDGLDLIYIGDRYIEGQREAVFLDRSSGRNTKVHWTLGGRSSGSWVMVLDRNNKPVTNGQVVTFDFNGKQVG